MGIKVPHEEQPRSSSFVEVLPRIRTKIQLTGLAVAIVGFVMIRLASPDAVRAQLAAGSIGICLVVFAQIFHFMEAFPARSRVTLVIAIFFAFLIFTLLMAGIVSVELKPASIPEQTEVERLHRIRELTLALKNEDPTARRQAAEELVAFGGDAASELVKAISEEAGVTTANMFGSAAGGDMTETLARIFLQEQPFQSTFTQAAIECLVEIGPASVPHILRRLEAESIEAEKILAASAQERTRAQQPPLASLEQLRFVFGSAARGMRIGIARESYAQALLEIGHPAVPALLDGLESERLLVRMTSYQVLTQIPDAIPSTLARLQQMAARATNRQNREEIVGAIRQLEARSRGTSTQPTGTVNNSPR
jgi:hypothetical protein